MNAPITWLLSTVGKRNYIAHYLRESSPAGSVIIGTGCDPYTPGFAACDRSYLVPPISDRGYPKAVMDVCRREQVDAILTLSDIDVIALSRIRSKLQNLGVDCFFPSERVAERFGNKFATFEYLRKLEVGTPRTSKSLQEAIDTFNFPLVIKPAYGSASSGFSVLNDAKAAELHWRAIDQPIAQEFIDGRMINVELCGSGDGELVGFSVWERMSSVAGETLLATTIDHPSALQVAFQIAQDSKIPGPIDMDILDSNGALFVIDVNTRFGGGYPVSHLARADFTGALVACVQGKVPQLADRYVRGVTMMKEIRPFIYDDRNIRSL